MNKDKMPESGLQKIQGEKDDKKKLDIDNVGIFTLNKPATAKEVIEEMEKNGMRPASIEELILFTSPEEDTVDLKEGEDYTIEDDDSEKLKELNK